MSEVLQQHNESRLRLTILYKRIREVATGADSHIWELSPGATWSASAARPLLDDSIPITWFSCDSPTQRRNRPVDVTLLDAHD
ncbi:hypothetical protein HBI51_140920 [Parastagonospora nodorum]|nr:hypothetical protein HBI51_140920 [Parastagonospora nodorum]